MKKFIFLTAIIMGAVGLVSGQETAPRSPGSELLSKLAIQPIELAIPEVGKGVDRVVLDNGLTIYLYEDHHLPIFNISTLIHCGDIFDPADKDGLSGLVGTVMRTGGTKSISGDSINVLMEYIGGSLECHVGMENGSVSLDILSKDVDLGLKLYADLLRNPAFPQDKLDLAKADIRNSIKRRNDNPSGVVNMYFDNIVYGDHPYGRILNWASVKNVTVQDLVDYHKKFFVPNQTIIGVSGDFKKDEIIGKLKEYLGNWPKSTEPLPPYPPVEYKYHPGVYEIRKDINQGYISIGELGIRRDNPDRFAISIMNYILGGGSFTSRLTSKVRSDEGLAYHVGSTFETDSRDFGTFDAVCQTKSATTFKAIDLMVAEIKKIRDQGVSEQELKEARDAVINRFVFTFDSPARIVGNLMNLEFNGLPEDYYRTYLDNYRKISTADIKRVAMEYLKPDQLSYIVVGMPDKFEKSLDVFGPVKVIDLSPPLLD
ncbi:conserved hypothetical protein [Candidatus Zixiibacteriota bacterium]|nr:conserved hypothetical protein [candidate division Zixibacteria bacterium]